jgi:hypothetical protein
VEHDGFEYGFWARWFNHKEPVFAKLIIDAERLTLEGEVNPGFGHSITGEFCETRTLQVCDMITNGIPIFANRQRTEMTTAVVHPDVEEVRHW